MIASLRGELREVEVTADHAAELVVEVGGVGYRVLVAARLVAGLGPIGSEVSLAVHTHVREGALTLYGFSSPRERRSFEVLVASHGIGPSLGLAILSVHAPDALAAVVERGDVDALMTVPGVGRKTAQRLVVELSGRLVGLTPGGVGPGEAGGAVAEVAQALSALGYGGDEIRVATEGLDEDGAVETLLRAALRQLAPQR